MSRSERVALILWRARLAYRQAKLRRYERNNAPTHAARWRKLVDEAQAQVTTRQKQLGPPVVTTVSAGGVSFIKGFEGFGPKPYDDGTGTWTIGYGHIEGITPRSPHITEPEAADLLMKDLDRKYAPPVAALRLPLNQHQFDALVSFVYNLGPGVIDASTSVGRELRAHNYYAAANAMLAYDHAGGQRLAGLTRRREAERAMFLKP